MTPLRNTRALGRARWAACLGAIALLAACSSSDHKDKPTALTPVAGPIAIHRAWEVDLGSAEGTFLRPCLLENAVYAAAHNGTLVRLDPSNGKEVWRVSVQGGIEAGVGCDGVNVAVAGPRGNVVAFDAAGKQLWEAQASSDILAPPLVGHGVVVVRANDQRITAFELESGKRRWVFQKQEPSLALRVESDIAFHGDNVIVGFPGGRIDGIALSNGAGKWDALVSEPKGATEVERLSDVLGVPAVSGDDVCAASYQGRIACFDDNNGDLRWAREFSATAGVALTGDTVVGVDASSHVNAFNRGNGAGLWQNGALAFRNVSAPVIVGSFVAVGDFEGKIHFLRLDDGKIVGRFEESIGTIISSPQSWNGSALFQTSRGYVLMLSPGS
jgi:outer membrane protein assembly factor BamB